MHEFTEPCTNLYHPGTMSFLPLGFFQESRGGLVRKCFFCTKGINHNKISVFLSGLLVLNLSTSKIHYAEIQTIPLFIKWLMLPCGASVHFIILLCCAVPLCASTHIISSEHAQSTQLLLQLRWTVHVFPSKSLSEYIKLSIMHYIYFTARYLFSVKFTSRQPEMVTTSGSCWVQQI